MKFYFLFLALVGILEAQSSAEILSDHKLWEKKEIALPNGIEKSIYVYSRNPFVTGIREDHLFSSNESAEQSFHQRCFEELKSSGLSEKDIKFSYSKKHNLGQCQFLLNGKVSSSFVYISMRPTKEKKVYQASTEAIEIPNDKLNTIQAQLEKIISGAEQ